MKPGVSAERPIERKRPASRRRERALRARDAGLPRVGLDRNAEGPGGRLEDGFGDVVAVPAVVEDRVEVGPERGGHALPEDLDELGVERADRRHGEIDGENAMDRSANSTSASVG